MHLPTSAIPTGLGSGDGGINVWGSVAIPKKRTVQEPDFSKPEGAAGVCANVLPSAPLQEAARRQATSASPAAQPLAAGALAAGEAAASGGAVAAASRAPGSKRRSRRRSGSRPTLAGWFAAAAQLCWGCSPCTAHVKTSPRCRTRTATELGDAGLMSFAPTAKRPSLPAAGTAEDSDGLAAGLRTPDVEPMYATSHLLTVR